MHAGTLASFSLLFFYLTPQSGYAMPENTIDASGLQTAEDAGALDIKEPDNALPPVQLEGLPPVMQEACGRAGWTSLMPVQSLALPYLMDGRDIMIQSRTGSGKTGCYLLPMLPVLKTDARHPQALVLVPTRELALQVEKEAQTLLEGTGCAPIALYGGVGYKKQLDALKDGAQLVIGTPGRVLDHILRRSLDLSGIRMLVFDEADRMLSIGFYPDMKEIQKYLPRHRIHTSLFSATYPPHVLNLASEFMTEPSMLSLSQKEVYVAEVQHYFCNVKPMDKDRALVRIIEMENPASAIIFCNTKANVHYVCGVLQGFGYNADELSADLTQSRREEVMAKVRTGQVRFLVATDVAARGIDIPALSHVFLYEPPEDHESYIHRAGRTGRAGAAGTVVSLVDIMERMELERISKHYSLTLLEMKDPTDEDVAKVVSNRLMAQLESRYRKLTGLERVRAQRYVQLARDLAVPSPDDEGDSEGVNLLAMLLDACRQGTLNESRLPGAHAGSEPRKKSSRKRKRRQDGQESQDSQDGQDRQEQAQPEGAGDEDKGKSRRRRRPRRRRGHGGGSGEDAGEGGGPAPQGQDSAPSSQEA
jgi:ATP-dependent RNA helicase DeaD